MGKTEGRGGLEEECAPGGRLVLWDSGGGSSLAWPGAPPNTSGAPSGARGCLWLTVSPSPALPSGTLLSQEQA